LFVFPLFAAQKLSIHAAFCPRISTGDQNPAMQLAALKKAGCKGAPR